MAKVIKYKFLSAEIDHGTAEQPDVEQVFLDKTLAWSEENEEIAKREAHNGEYTIEDDGKQEEEDSAQDDIKKRVEALESAVSQIVPTFSTSTKGGK